LPLLAKAKVGRKRTAPRATAKSRGDFGMMMLAGVSWVF
jgi:hypothetical protein